MTRNIKLYKYLDVNGGLMMLHNSNLQFTNATRLNDPFDCHPALFDFSHAPEYHAIGPRKTSWLKKGKRIRRIYGITRGFAAFLRFMTPC